MNPLFDLIKNNQFLATGLGLSSVGILSFWLKDVPGRFYDFLHQEFTTSLTLTSQHKIFYDFMGWIELKYPQKNFRRLKVRNGQWGESKENIITSIGYGLHLVRYKNNLLWFDLIKESANQTERDKETLVVTKLGRDRTLFHLLLKEVKDSLTKSTDIELHKLESSYWEFIKKINRRNLDTIFMPQKDKESLINTLHTFLNSETWYINNGIPYQLGILLYGVPGSGKTSLIRAIADALNYNIYYLPTCQMPKITSACNSLPNKCILVIEDIDCNTVTHQRKMQEQKDEDLITPFTFTDISEILNALDGIGSPHGRILIATTNHIEKLDSALLRPGRIDLKIEMGYINSEIFSSFMNHFFSKDKLIIYNFELQPNITIAMLQELILQKKTESEILDFVKL